MASHKTEKTWSDLQERLLMTPDGLPNRPSIDLRRGPQVVVPPLFHAKATGREEAPRKSSSCSFQQPLGHLKPSDILDAAVILPSDLLLQNRPSMKQQEHEGNKKASSRTWSHSVGLQRELAAIIFFRENKLFAWNFVDSFILEVLRDELVPDALMEVLSSDHTKHPPLYSPTRKSSHTQSELQQATKLAVCKQQPAVSILDILLEKIVSDLAMELIRSVVEELVNNHLITAAINKSLTELMEETIEPMIPQLVKEAVSEILLEGILQEEILPDVLDEEVRNVAVLQLSEYDTEMYEQQQEEVRTNAEKRLIDMFLLENLLKIIGSQGTAFSEKIELDRLLDSSRAGINGEWVGDGSRNYIRQLNNNAPGSVDQSSEIAQRFNYLLNDNPQNTSGYVDNLRQKVAPLTDDLRQKMTTDTENLHQRITQVLQEMRTKLSPSADGVHQRISRNVEEFHQTLTPYAEELRQTVIPYTELEDNTKNRRDILIPLTETLQQGLDENWQNVSESRPRLDLEMQEIIDRLLPEGEHGSVKVVHQIGDIPQDGPDADELEARLSENVRRLAPYTLQTGVLPEDTASTDQRLTGYVTDLNSNIERAVKAFNRNEASHKVDKVVEQTLSNVRERLGPYADSIKQALQFQLSNMSDYIRQQVKN
ncbi:uncharacterized protein [Heterodontus francisci]|uniref:uncharacterized protein isoform X2 n=1 Tax=Heterodontus francisci TaxID=7792 RepID=UPI00355C0C77